jgi:sensor histidine kinase YesM
LRKTVFFPEQPDTLMTLGLYQVAAVSASEIYWDGELVACNGTVGASIDEEAYGKSGQIYCIPGRLSGAGKHVMAVRQSNFHAFSGTIDSPFRFGLLNSLRAQLFRIGAMSLFLAGIFVITALFHIAILLGHVNKWTYMLFSAFCLSCTAFIVIRSTIHYFQTDLGLYYTMALFNDIPWFLMMSLLPIFFLFKFSAPRRLTLSIAILALTLCIVILPRLVIFGLLPVSWLPLLDTINRAHSISTIVMSIFVTVWAIRKRKVGSLTVAIGLFIFLIGAYISYRAHIENGWAIGFAFLILVITISLSRQMAQRDRQLQETRLRSARLELELLKRHIQPHFLLNSLNSIVAWLEEEPSVAAKLVTSLADELRMLLTFSGRKTVSLAKEMELCRAHVQVMSLRQDKKFTFEATGAEGNERVPPLVIHTLVENGLTHGYSSKDSGTFRLTVRHDGGALRLELFNDSSLDSRAVKVVEGTGLKYVRTRLEETYPGAWELASGPVEGGWNVVIVLKRERS